MTANFRLYIANQVAQLLQQEVNLISNQIRVTGRNYKSFGFILPVNNVLTNQLPKGANTFRHSCQTAQNLAQQVQIDNHYIHNVTVDKASIIFQPNHQTLMTEVLNNAMNNNAVTDYSNETKKHILVDYSSPNIAKPFHVGHLRSTFIGNFIANINEYFGNKVTRINYLGDWGVQFGLLGVGFQKFGSTESLINNAIKHLFDVYVQINNEMERDASIQERARLFARRMEEDDEECINLWKQFRSLSIKEYKKIYKDIIEKLRDDGLLVDNRDIVAAIDRFERFNFDEMYYVTSSAQNLHFQHLFKILNLSGYNWVKNCYHVDFGMVKGMSTRTGNVVFLQDILDDAKERMMKTLSRKHNDPSSIAELVGLAAILIQDLKAKRIKDYEFNWEKMLASHGDTGPRLQYEHARLVSIAEKTQVPINMEADITSLLSENSAIKLVEHITRFEGELVRAKLHSEPCFLVNYLFILSHLISAANHNLKVLGQTEKIAEARMLLFAASRNTLAKGLNILGVKPLNKM
ncbi:uncharacterized protein TRIADDRAFT_56525 [Trichoplax adhaerens]|uniref:Probable arginine--tRNA ligase, mitochondrial n=1 Tax=Trichoplax adhaerens TaxID=10228 RepID=B3RYE0_TRIAD|nr:hypothetical protein TRIADDRAFT_56525 [Trichoplax adhaerens]EDV24582.1 hypothetical protein TRIADDRAFT_56525 [Trichoplax adhaerens]|eukprot:XP_002112472.1 hypothetical protein TRIADDRAFT_56525 [Trichoplax adhaerens]